MKLRIRIWYPEYYDLATGWTIGRKRFYVTFSWKVLGLVLFVLRDSDKLSNKKLKELIAIQNMRIQKYHDL